MERLCLFYKIYKNHTPLSLRNLIPQNFQISYYLRTIKQIHLFMVKHGFFKSSFFPSTKIEWNNLGYYLRNVPSFSSFKQKIFKFNFVDSEKIYNVHNPSGPNLLTRQRLGLIHLRALTFSHNCSHCLNELCIYCTNIKPTNHFLLQCPLYISEGKALM